MADEKTNIAWSGTCRECLINVTLWPHPDADEEEREWLANGPDEWDSFSDCFVCGGTIEWNGSDLVSDVIR